MIYFDLIANQVQGKMQAAKYFIIKCLLNYCLEMLKHWQEHPVMQTTWLCSYVAFWI